MRRLLLLLLFTSVSCVYWTPTSRQISASAKVIPDVPVQKWDILTCGAGALSSVLQHHGDPTTMDAWQEALPKTRGGVMSIDLVLAARQKGFDAQLVTGDPGTIEGELQAGRPVILMLQVVQAPGKGYDFFHYVVLDGVDPANGTIRTQFGDGKVRWVRLERMEKAWEGAGRAAILIRPPDPHAQTLRTAVRLEEEGKLALAAHEYRQLLATDPTSTLAWTNLGNVEMRAGRAAAAEDAYRQAIERDPDAADALNNLAWLLFEQKRLEEAEPLARRAAATTAPDPWTRLDTLAQILAAQGRCDEAKETFTRAIAAVPASRAADREQLQT
ncbi:MAG: tetratricopeptide repeat protein, partial [Thermoanaerobaculia bacterium]